MSVENNTKKKKNHKRNKQALISIIQNVEIVTNIILDKYSRNILFMEWS